jgi:hypothetical protein
MRWACPNCESAQVLVILPTRPGATSLRCQDCGRAWTVALTLAVTDVLNRDVSNGDGIEQPEPRRRSSDIESERPGAEPRAAVDGQGLAGDERGGRRSQERDGIGDL